ncbi:hypothetical protein M2271_002291 [Streptomyces sp. LBL]|nr:hypothetical protein [Streptomyces sp. LBL]
MTSARFSVTRICPEPVSRWAWVRRAGAVALSASPATASTARAAGPGARRRRAETAARGSLRAFLTRRVCSSRCHPAGRGKSPDTAPPAEHEQRTRRRLERSRRGHRREGRRRRGRGHCRSWSGPRSRLPSSSTSSRRTGYTRSGGSSPSEAPAEGNHRCTRIARLATGRPPGSAWRGLWADASTEVTSGKSKSPRSRRVSPEAFTEPPSGFEPETYALRDHE